MVIEFHICCTFQNRVGRVLSNYYHVFVSRRNLVITVYFFFSVAILFAVLSWWWQNPKFYLGSYYTVWKWRSQASKKSHG